MLFQIRGTSGSGKSYIVFKLFEKYSFKKITTKNGKVMGYYCKQLNLFIVGRYETKCGGCDSIPTQDEICRRVRKGLKNGWNVLFEGLICSHTAKRYAELYAEASSKGIETFYIFLDTPLEKCRENINKRRASLGKPPTTAKNTEKDYTSTHKSRENMHTLGIPNRNMPILNSKETYKFILKKLREE